MITRNLAWKQITAVDNCEGDLPVNCTITHNMGINVDLLLLKKGGDFPPGVTTVWCDSIDNCGNQGVCHFSVINSGQNSLHIEVELSPTMDAGPLTRGIEFSVSDCGAANPESITASANVNFGFPFNIPGHGVAQVKIPSGNYMCLEARDPLHTLNATCTLTCEVIEQKGSVWFSSFKGTKDLSDTCHWLVNGNLNGLDGDGIGRIDVIDYVVYLAAGANNPIPGGNTPLGTVGPHADINGDGIVSLLDFSFILVNLFNTDKAGCDAICSPSAAAPIVAGGRESITLRELAEMGLGREGITADLDHNGVVNTADMALYLNSGGTATSTGDDVARDLRGSTKGTRSVRGLR